jgi:glutaredoxin
MKAKEASHAKTQEKIQNAMHAQGENPAAGAGAAPGAEVQKPIVPPAATVDEDTEEIPIAGRTKMTVPKKGQDTDVQQEVQGEKSEEEKEREEKEKKEADAKSELNDILKRAPGMFPPTDPDPIPSLTDPVIVFSKSYCPYSKKAKSILLEHYAIQPKPFVVELDQHPLGPYLQALLGQKTGRRTVPNVLVSGKSIGGGDDIAALDQRDELASTLKSLGGKWIVEVEHLDLEVEKGL